MKELYFQSKDKNIKARVGERLACQYLELNNFEILTTRYRPLPNWSALGEIDILARRRNELWVFEVKTRQELWNEFLNVEQAKRIKNSMFYLSSRYPTYITRWALLWINSKNGEVEFLENPC